MNRWNEIELAAADRRRNDLRNAKRAHQVRAARADQPTQPRSRHWITRIIDLLLQHRTRRATITPEANSVGVKQ